jgi:hypothetical protein
MKKYSTPFCSVPLGALDVQDIENARFSSWCSFISHEIIVDFPVPLGALKMINLPLIILKFRVYQLNAL